MNLLKQVPKVHSPIEIKNWDCHSWSPDTSLENAKVWVPVRSENLYGMYLIQRIKVAWGVFTGRYDALDWNNLNE